MTETESQKNLRARFDDMPRDLLARIADAYEEAERIRRVEVRRRFRPRTFRRQP